MPGQSHKVYEVHAEIRTFNPGKPGWIPQIGQDTDENGSGVTLFSANLKFAYLAGGIELSNLDNPTVPQKVPQV